MKLPIKGSCPFLDYVLRYEYWPARPGCMYRRNGDPGDPPEPAEVDWSLHKAEGDEISWADFVAEHAEDYTEGQLTELILEAIGNDIVTQQQSALDDRAEAQYEDLKEC